MSGYAIIMGTYLFLLFGLIVFICNYKGDD